MKVKKGFCQCRCGQKTTIVNRSRTSPRLIKGTPRKFISGHNVRLHPREENHYNWKGDKVGIRSLHKWVERQLGKPKLCEHCKKEDKKLYDWANKSGLYKRDLSDWIRLCKHCHREYDKDKISRGERVGTAKLTEKKVLKIRELYIKGKTTYKEISNMFNITFQTIGCIILRKTWKHI